MNSLIVCLPCVYTGKCMCKFDFCYFAHTVIHPFVVLDFIGQLWTAHCYQKSLTLIKITWFLSVTQKGTLMSCVLNFSECVVDLHMIYMDCTLLFVSLYHPLLANDKLSSSGIKKNISNTFYTCKIKLKVKITLLNITTQYFT